MSSFVGIKIFLRPTSLRESTELRLTRSRTMHRRPRANCRPAPITRCGVTIWAGHQRHGFGWTGGDGVTAGEIRHHRRDWFTRGEPHSAD